MTIRKIIITMSVFALASTAAYAATSRTYYRACCTDEPERHGCGISGWHDSEDDANLAGARHSRKTSGHAWSIESVDRSESQ